MNNMKLIMESWRQNVLLKEDVERPKTWGELAQKILMARAAERWPRLGKSLLRMGWKAVSGVAKSAIGVLEQAEGVLDMIPDEWEEGLRNGTEVAAEKFANFAKFAKFANYAHFANYANFEKFANFSNFAKFAN